MNFKKWPRRQPPSLKLFSSHVLQRIIQTMYFNVINGKRNEIEFRLNTTINCLKENILKFVPVLIADTILEAFKNTVLFCSSKLKDGSKFLLENDIKMEIIYEIILNLNIRSLDLTNETYVIGNTSLLVLPSVPHIQHLKLLGIQCHDDEDLIIRGLLCLKNLKKFEIDVCTDDVLCALASSCKHLEEVTIYVYDNLSNEGINELAACKSLTGLGIGDKIENTITTIHGELFQESVSVLIRSLPKLKTICFNELEGCLQILYNKVDINPIPNLKIISNFLSSIYLNEINALFPQITKLRLMMETFKVVTGEKKFMSLEVLVLSRLDIRHKISVSIFNMSPVLLHLKIHYVHHISAQCVQTIAKCCPLLKTLYIRKDLRDGEHVVVSDFDEIIEFYNLEVLYMSNVKLDVFLIFMHCPKLQKIYIKSTSVVAESVDKFYAVNKNSPIRKLCFDSLYSPYLGCDMVYKTLKTLKDLEELSVDFACTYHSEIDDLREHVLNNYQSIDFEINQLFHEWSDANCFNFSGALRRVVQMFDDNNYWITNSTFNDF